MSANKSGTGPASKQAVKPITQDGETELTIPTLGGMTAAATQESGPGGESETGIDVTPMTAADVAEMRQQIASLTRLMATNNPVNRPRGNDVGDNVTACWTSRPPATWTNGSRAATSRRPRSKWPTP
jgi:hypothetical protein